MSRISRFKMFEDTLDDLSKEELKIRIRMLQKENGILAFTCSRMEDMNQHLLSIVSNANMALAQVRNFPTNYQDAYCVFNPEE